MKASAEFIGVGTAELEARMVAIRDELTVRERDAIMEQRIPDTSRRMLVAIGQLVRERREGSDGSPWILREFDDEQLLTIARFIRGFRESE